MDNEYELIIIGGGITGLATGITWALNKDVSRHRVVLLEKEPKLGGCVTSYKRGGYLFDTTQMSPDMSTYLSYLGITLDVKRFEGYYARIFFVDPETKAVTPYHIPSGWQDFERALGEHFPDYRDKIKKFGSYSRGLFAELSRAKQASTLLNFIKMIMSCPKAVRNHKRTFAQYLSSFGINDPVLRGIFDVFAAFSGLPCERVSAIAAVGALASTMEGAYRTQKGFIKLPHAMRRRFEELGGEVRTRAEVDRILIEGKTVKGVRLTSGETIAAHRVVCSGDTAVTVQKLIGIDRLRPLDSRYADKAAKIKMSPSSMTVGLGLDDKIDLAQYGMDCGYNVITTGKGTFETLFQAFDRGEVGLSDSCFHLAAICPSLTTGGKSVLIIRAVPLPMAQWITLRETDPTAYQQKKTELADFLIDKVERYLIPQLSRHIVVRDIASPATFARYLGSPSGSNYDMAPYPDNFGRKRLAMQTPIRGLLIPKFSHSIAMSMNNGMQAVDAMLGGVVMNGNVRYSG